nr:MAG TPA: hypothetical protein [Caudoviricetes sp.]
MKTNKKSTQRVQTHIIITTQLYHLLCCNASRRRKWRLSV